MEEQVKIAELNESDYQAANDSFFENKNFISIARKLSLSSKDQFTQSPVAREIIQKRKSAYCICSNESLKSLAVAFESDSEIQEGGDDLKMSTALNRSSKKVSIRLEAATPSRLQKELAISPSSSGPQDVNLEPTGSIPFSFGIRSPGKTSPLRGRNMKEYEEQFDHLKKENFALKLRIYFLEEKLDQRGIKEDKKELHKANIELKVETEALKKQLYDKQELVRQAAALLTNLENQFKEQLQAANDSYERETQELRETIADLQKKLDDRASQENGDLTQLCGLAFSSAADNESEMVDLGNSILPPARLQGVFSMQDPFERRVPHTIKNVPVDAQKELIPESAKKKIKDLEDEVERLSTKVQDLESTLEEKERISQALQEDIDNLKKEIEERDEKVTDLEQEVAEKDQKVDQLMQELETRHLEIAAKDSTIQTLHDDLNKVEPQIEVKVQEIIEKDRIIEEKKEQLQQQNKILVEIQITLDEKQKQIAELEESLMESREKMEQLSREIDFSLTTIKEMAVEVGTRDKEILQLKKELKKKEKKVKDLLAELKEALDMLKKAKWEAETNGGQDGVKEMVEEENERLWAELEQGKLEMTQMRKDKETLAKEIENKMKILRKEKEEVEEQLRLLQKQIATENKGERDKIDSVEHASCIQKIEAREELLRSQEIIIETLKSDLATAKKELLERKEELKELKRELSVRNKDIQEVFSKELFGRNRALEELQSKLCSMPLGQNNPLEALKLLLEASQMKQNSNSSPTKEVQQQAQVRSNSLSKLSEHLIHPSEKVNTQSQQSKTGRSNSFSLLENMLYANMGQKVYNTNQTFNTYVLSSDTEGKQGDIISLKGNSSTISADAMKVGLESQEDFKNKVLLASILCRDQKVSAKNTDLKSSVLPTKEGVEVEICSAPEPEGERNLELLYEEVNNIRNEAHALRKDREILIQKVSALQALNEQLSYAPVQTSEPTNTDPSQSGHANVNNEQKFVSHLRDEIKTLKDDLKGAKQRVNLQMLQIASTKYQDSLKNYKQEIISLRKRLADSHNACDLLRNRLEELVDFFEQILEMDNKGIINLSLTSPQRSSLRKSLENSRSLSLTLSHSLMIGTDSILGESLASQNDIEASRYCLPFENLPEEVDLTQLQEAEDVLNYSDCGVEADLTNDFMYYSFAAKINSEVDEKSEQLNKLASNFSLVSKLLESKEEQIKTEADTVKCLQSEIADLREQLHVKNQLLNDTEIGYLKSAGHLNLSGQLLEIQNATNSSLHLSALQYSLMSSNTDNIDPNIHKGLFIVPGESSSSDTLPPPPLHCASQDESVEKAKTKLSDVCSPYSTDLVIKNLPSRESNAKPSISRESCLQDINLEELTLPPTFALASPSESEAWSEPDRNVSLARIGLETCNLVSVSHDRSLSRSRMTRSAPFTSESEGEGIPEEVKESSVGLGTPSTKPKRRSDAAEVKRLTSKLKTLEQLNETLRAELLIYQTLNPQFNSAIGNEHQLLVAESVTLEQRDNEENGLHKDENISSLSVITPSLLQEIRSLRMKLEEAIANNDLLRDQLEAALSGYLSEETRNLTTKLSSIQQELRLNQEKLFIASNTEHHLRTQIKDNEAKIFELGERLANYLTTNQKLEQKISELNQELLQLQQSESDKDRRAEEQRKYVAKLEEAQCDYEVKLAEQNVAFKELVQCVNTLRQESNKISTSDLLVSELNEALQDREERLLEVTKERFALIGESTRLKSQLASATTQTNLLMREVRELSISEDLNISEDHKQMSQKLQLADATIKELSRNNELHQSEKKVLQNEMKLMREESSSLRVHLDQVISRETVASSKASQELESLQLAYEDLKEKYATLDRIYQNAHSDKNMIENRVKELHEKEDELKASLIELESKRKDLSSQLETERCITKNLQIQIKNLQLYSPHPIVPSDHKLKMTNVSPADLIRPSDITSPIKIGSFNESASLLSWNENKENRFPHCNLPPKGTLSLPNIEDDATSGDSPDLGIGSDGQFSSLERLTSSSTTTILKSSLNQRFYNLESEIEERENKLCSEPSHSRLFSENERLRDEREKLKAQLASCNESLESARSQISEANQKKKSVERRICKELSKTHDVLRRANGNLCNRNPEVKSAQRQIPSAKNQK